MRLYWSASQVPRGWEQDIWSIVLHELGHAAGLDHSDITQAVMGSVPAPGGLKRNLGGDDIRGIQAIYGAYTDESFWATNTQATPGETVTLFLDYPRSAGAQFQIMADFDGLSAGCPLRTLWGADSRIFSLDACPDPATGRWKRTPLERLVMPTNTGTLDGNGHAQVSVQIPASLSCFPTNRRWHFSAVVYNPTLDPSGIEDVGVGVALDIQPRPGPVLHARQRGGASAGEVELSWYERALHSYTLEHTDAPGPEAQWELVSDVVIVPLGDGWATNVVDASGSQRFFRVREREPLLPCTGLLAIVVSTNYLRVPEGDRATFTVQLNQPPVGSVEVALNWIGGDGNLKVANNSRRSFDAGNWDTPMTFTISAQRDADAFNGIATFTLSGDGLADVLITAEEIDDDL